MRAMALGSCMACNMCQLGLGDNAALLFVLSGHIGWGDVRSVAQASEMILHLGSIYMLYGIEVTRVALGEALTSRMSFPGSDFCIIAALYPTCPQMFVWVLSQSEVLKRAFQSVHLIQTLGVGYGHASSASCMHRHKMSSLRS